MSGKYTPDELQQMAIQFNQYYASGDQRAYLMLDMLETKTNTQPTECLVKIKALEWKVSI